MAEEPFNTGAPSIGDRVKFWEEQDKINQELIPRVIRQHELLAEHIGEHANLPEIAGSAISQALAGAREEQRQTVLNQGLATLRQESRKTRNLLIGITAGLGAVSVAIMIAGILIL